MKNILRVFAVALVTAIGISCACPKQETLIDRPMRDRLGVTHTGSKYALTEKPCIIEAAEKLDSLGFGVIKFFLNKDMSKPFPYHCDWGERKDSYVEVVKHPYFQQIFNMGFSTVVFNISDHGGQLEAEHPDFTKVSLEIEDLANYLLETYKDKEITFIIKNWEGDWMLRGGFKSEAEWAAIPEATRNLRAKNFAAWMSARQQAVENARNQHKDSKCNVYNAMEANKVMESMKGLTGIGNSVLPNVTVDLISWSSYDGLYSGEGMAKGIDYLQQQHVNKGAFPGPCTVMIGEIGFPEQLVKFDVEERMKDCYDAALAKGVPYIIYWEMYCNEPKDESKRKQFYPMRKTEEMRGFWLFRPDGTESIAKKVLCDYLRADDQFNYVLGTQQVGAKYKFTDNSNLVETAQAISDMGSNFLKISMSPRYWWENYDVPRNPEITSLVELAQEENFKKVLEMPFAIYNIWAYEFSQYTQEPAGQKIDSNQVKFIGGLSDEYAQKSYQEIYDLAKYLLETYSGTGKTFYLGNWEGDWHLYWNYKTNKNADPKTIEGMIKWFNVRQQAIDDAKRDANYHDVELYHYVEVNKSDLAMKGQPCLTNSVLPHINPDYVSFSSYCATNPPKSAEEMDEMLTAHLDLINSNLKPKKGIEGFRVYLGEFGWPEHRMSLDQIAEKAKWVFRTCLKKETKFCLFWEMYNNEILKDGSQNGFWLIDQEGQKTPLYYVYAQYYKEAKAFVRQFKADHGREPSHHEFCQAAVKFQSLQ